MPIQSYAILKELLQVTAPFLRDQFFGQCVEAMARLLGAEFTFVSRVLDAPATKVRVLAAWQNGSSKETWDFDLAGTPCELIYDPAKAELMGALVIGQGPVLIPEGLCNQFPATRSTNYQGFIGIPLWSRQGVMIGHMACLYTTPLRDDPRAMMRVEVLQLLAHRVEAELEHVLIEEEMARANDALRRANERLLKDSVTDPLTQIANRRYFTQRCAEVFAHFQRSKEAFCLLVIDVDHFKEINDRHGHEAGDRTLQGIADCMMQYVRAGVETVARLGGEEFAVISQGGWEVGVQLAERLRRQLADFFIIIDSREVRVTVSIGVACARPDDTGWESIYRRADQALYSAKAQGRNAVYAEADPLPSTHE